MRHGGAVIDVQIKTFKSIHVARVRHVGPYTKVGPCFEQLFGEWLHQSGESIADGPCMELYRKSTVDTPPEHLSTDLCVPLPTPKPRG